VDSRRTTLDVAAAELLPDALLVNYWLNQILPGDELYF